MIIRVIRFVVSRHKLAFALILFTGILGGVGNLVIAAFPAVFIDLVLNHGSATMALAAALYGLFVLLMISWGRYMSYKNTMLVRGIHGKIWLDIIKRLFTLDLEYLEQEEFLEKNTRILDNFKRACDNVFSLFSELLGTILVIIVSSSVFLSVNRIIVLIAIVGTVLEIAISGLLTNLENQKTIELSEFKRQKNVLTRMFYLGNSIREIKSFGYEKFSLNKARKVYDESIVVERKFLKSTNKLNFTSSFINQIFTLLPIAVFGIFTMQGNLELSMYFLLIAMYIQFSGAVKGLLSAISLCYDMHVFSREYFEFFDSKEISITNIISDVSVDDVESIELKNVGYRYETNEKNSLTNINLSIKKGEKVAIVGVNGAGKSTLLKIITGLYTPTEGDIEVNDMPLQTISSKDLRDCFNVLFQDFYMFPFTIRENLSFDLNYDENQLWDLLRKYGLETKIMSLPTKLDTGIGGEYYSDYTELSGGEKQKLAIVRMLLNHKPSVLVLDEPVNNLEVVTEEIMYDDIFNQPDKTVIIVSHKLSFMPKMDRIIVMDSGEIVEIGTHNELIKNNHSYAKMYNMQYSKYGNVYEESQEGR